MGKPRVLLQDGLFPCEAIVDLVANHCSDVSSGGGVPSGARRGQEMCCAQLGSRHVFLKHYRTARRGWERWRPLRFTRAWRSYRAGIRLREMGIATPAPRFLVGWNGSLVLGCDQVEAEQLYHLLRNATQPVEAMETAIRGVAEILDRLETGKVTHGDLHPRNLLVDRDGKVWLVDLDGVRFHRTRRSFVKRRRKEETRLATQLEIRPELISQIGLRKSGSI